MTKRGRTTQSRISESNRIFSVVMFLLFTYTDLICCNRQRDQMTNEPHPAVYSTVSVAVCGGRLSMFIECVSGE
jgi:hypothetical protein